MKRFRFERGLRSPVLWLVVAGCLVTAGLVPASPGYGRGPQQDATSFLGLWMGVDPLDGSPVRLSLSDVDGDGVLAHTLQEDFYTACFNLGPLYSRGRGVVNGTAIVASNGVLDVTSELVCLSDANVPQSLGVGTQQYTLGSGGRVLVLPAFGASPAIVLHHAAP
jgi:hypothetical protein